MSNDPRRSPHGQNGDSAAPGEIPAAFRAGPGDVPGMSPAAAPAMAEEEARNALAAQATQAQQRQAVHDEIAGLLARDPAALLQAAPDLYGQAVAAMVAAGVTQALQAPVQVKVTARACAECLRLQIEWAQRYGHELEDAKRRAMASIGATDPSDPRLPQVDLPSFLPERLRPGRGSDALPVLMDPVTTVDGTEVCFRHHPAARSKLITASGLSLAALLASQPGAPGMAMMPGVAMR